MTIAGIILAAGASRRMGSPKALLSFQGETFLDRLIRIFSAVCTQVVVVLGHEPERIRSAIKRQPHFELNPDYAKGQLTSLQCGLRGVNRPVDSILFTPVDYPAVQASTVRAVADGSDPRWTFVVPRHNGRHGHPILFAEAIALEFLRLPADATARDVVHRYRNTTRYIDVDDEGVLRDVDDPPAYAELLARRPLDDQT